MDGHTHACAHACTHVHTFLFFCVNVARLSPLKLCHASWLVWFLTSDPLSISMSLQWPQPNRWTSAVSVQVSFSGFWAVQTTLAHAWRLHISVQLGTVKLSRWRHWLNFIKTNGAAPRAAKLALQRSRLSWQLHQPWKKFWVARAFEVRWACTCCHDRTGFNCCLLPLSHFSLFFVSLGALHNPER